MEGRIVPHMLAAPHWGWIDVTMRRYFLRKPILYVTTHATTDARLTCTVFTLEPFRKIGTPTKLLYFLIISEHKQKIKAHPVTLMPISVTNL